MKRAVLSSFKNVERNRLVNSPQAYLNIVKACTKSRCEQTFVGRNRLVTSPRAFLNIIKACTISFCAQTFSGRNRLVTSPKAFLNIITKACTTSHCAQNVIVRNRLVTSPRAFLNIISKTCTKSRCAQTFVGRSRPVTSPHGFLNIITKACTITGCALTFHPPSFRSRPNEVFSTVLPLRSFASKANKKAEKKKNRKGKNKKKASITNKNDFGSAPPPRIINTPEHLQHNSPPPSFLTPTGSPHVFVATCAVAETGVSPVQLFDRSEIRPPSFRSGRFVYVHPKQFGHELPDNPDIPEVAVLGRSNVGKSTLLNAVFRQNLARTSKVPGRTQTVNYFSLLPPHGRTDERRVEPIGRLVDLPGYGWAKAPPKHVEEWQRKTQEFLLHRRDLGNLKRVLLLIDSRLVAKKGGGYGSLKTDHAVLGWLEEAGIPHSVVLTKTDAQKKAQLIRAVNDFCMRFHSLVFADQDDVAMSPMIHVTSGKNKTGVNELMWVLDSDFDRDEEEERESDFGHVHEDEIEDVGEDGHDGYEIDASNNELLKDDRDDSYR